MAKVESTGDERIVAYVDILGFKNLLDSFDESLAKIRKAFDETINRTLKFAKSPELEESSVRVFSDCIYVSGPRRSEVLSFLVAVLGSIQQMLALHGVFVRGGIASGRHFESEDILFSVGLQHAYKLETEAVYPRIIIDESLKEFIDEKLMQGVKSELRFRVLRAPDDFLFIDYLGAVLNECFEDFTIIAVIADHRAQVLDQVEKFERNTRILNKYRWVADYHNYIIDNLAPTLCKDRHSLLSEMVELKISAEDDFPWFSTSIG